MNKDDKMVDWDIDANQPMYGRRFDEANKNWSPNADHNRMFLKAQENYANDRLNARGYIFLNDIQDILGFDRTPQGQLVGWYKTAVSNPVDFNIVEVADEPGVFLLVFNPDGVIYEKI